MRRVLRLLNRFGMARAIALVLLVDLLLLRIWDPLPIEALRLRTFDLYQLIAPRVASQRPVVIVDIDEASLKALGQWPWPRTIVADLVTRATQMGALVIAFDVVFAEPDRSSPAEVVDSFRGLDDDTRAKLKALPSNDTIFAAAIGRSRVVLGQTALAQPSAPPQGDPLPQTGVGVKGPAAEPGLVTFPGLLRNLPELEFAAAGRGLFTIRPERDGIVRRVPIVMRAEGTIVPSLTLEMLRVVSGSPAILLRTDEAGMQGVALRGFEVPTDGHGQQWVHFGHHDKSRFVSAKDVLEGRVDAERFRGRLVLVGHLGGRAARSQDHPDRAGDARRRGPRPAPREHACPHRPELPELRDPRRACDCRARRDRDHRPCPGAWRLGVVLGRRHHGGAARCGIMVLLRATQSSD